MDRWHSGSTLRNPAQLWRAELAEEARRQDKYVYQNLKKLGDRFIGFVSGTTCRTAPSIGKAMNRKNRGSQVARESAGGGARSHTAIAGVIKGMSNIYGKELTAEQAWEKLIPCMSAVERSLSCMR